MGTQINAHLNLAHAHAMWSCMIEPLQYLGLDHAGPHACAWAKFRWAFIWVSMGLYGTI